MSPPEGKAHPKQLVAIVGAAGGIGQEVAKQLFEKYEVFGIDRRVRPYNWQGNFLRLELRSEGSVKKASRALLSQKVEEAVVTCC